MELLASLAAELHASDEVCARIRGANTARNVLEVCAAEGLLGIASLICRRVVEHGERYAGGGLRVRAELVDFNGTLLGAYPDAWA